MSWLLFNWGIICLVIAGVLTVANMRLPPENQMFQVREVNMPWFPPVVLANVGTISLIGSVLDLVGMDGVEGVVLIMVLGGYPMHKPWFEKRQLFGKVEMS